MKSLAHFKAAEIFVLLAMVLLLAVLTQKKEVSEKLPPVITISEDREEYRFKHGRSEIPPQLLADMREKYVPLLRDESIRVGCDTVEVIGHADESHIDKTRNDYFRDEDLITSFSNQEVEKLIPYTNVDLGILRALAIVQVLQEARDNGELGEVKYLKPYSAGQLIKLDGTLTTHDTKQVDYLRRRIEIRLVKSQR